MKVVFDISKLLKDVGLPLLSLSVLLPACLLFPISYSMGKGKEEGDRSAQAEDGGGGGVTLTSSNSC